MNEAWTDCLNDSSCTGVDDNHCAITHSIDTGRARLRLCEGYSEQDKSSCFYRRSSESKKNDRSQNIEYIILHDKKSPYFNNLVFLYLFLYQLTANGDPMANGHFARKLVEEGRSYAQDKWTHQHRMEENLVREKVRK